MNPVTQCLRKPDQYPVAHILLHAAAVIVPGLLFLWTPYASAVSVFCWSVVILIIGGHGEKAVGGDLGAFGVSVCLGGLTAAFVSVGPHTVALALFLGALVSALAWLTEYHQNGGEWCGQDVPNFHNRLLGAGAGTLAALAFHFFN